MGADCWCCRSSLDCLRIHTHRSSRRRSDDNTRLCHSTPTDQTHTNQRHTAAAPPGCRRSTRSRGTAEGRGGHIRRHRRKVEGWPCLHRQLACSRSRCRCCCLREIRPCRDYSCARGWPLRCCGLMKTAMTTIGDSPHPLLRCCCCCCCWQCWKCAQSGSSRCWSDLHQ